MEVFNRFDGVSGVSIATVVSNLSKYSESVIRFVRFVMCFVCSISVLDSAQYFEFWYIARNTISELASDGMLYTVILLQSFSICLCFYLIMF
jgi:hypothetical protein